MSILVVAGERSAEAVTAALTRGREGARRAALPMPVHYDRYCAPMRYARYDPTPVPG